MLRPSSPVSREYIARRPGLTPMAGLGGFGANILGGANGPYASAFWTPTAITETTGQTDPLGGSTASLLTDTAAASVHLTNQGAAVIAGLRYRVSLYFKPGTFAGGIDIDAGRTNGGGTIHVTNAGVVSVVGGTFTNLSSVTVGGFFFVSAIWLAGLSGVGLYTVSFGAGSDNAPLSYTGTLQNFTLWGVALQQAF